MGIEVNANAQSARFLPLEMRTQHCKELSPASLLRAGVALNKKVGKRECHGLEPRINEWITRAQEVIAEFIAKVNRDWTPCLVDQRMLYVNLGETLVSLQTKMGETPEEIDIPHYKRGQIKDQPKPEPKPKPNPRSNNETPVAKPVTRPDRNPYASKPIFEVYQDCQRFSRLLFCHPVTWEQEDQRVFRRLITWLQYLVDGNNLSQEYLTALEGDKKMLASYKQIFEQALDRFRHSSRL